LIASGFFDPGARDVRDRLVNRWIGLLAVAAFLGRVA